MTGAASGGLSARIVLRDALRSENANFYLLLGTVIFLVIIGLIVVFSASSIDSFLSDQGFFGGFLRQAGFAIVGIPLMLIVSRLPLVFWPTWAKRLLGLGVALQLLVFSPIGIETGGNRNWIAIGSFTAQPSEGLKVIIAVWLGVAIPLAIDRVGSRVWQVLLPVVPAVGLMGLVLLGSDLGTVMIMAIIVMGGLLFAGLPWRILSIPAIIGALGVVVVAVTSPNRMSRIMSFMSLDGCTDYSNTCWQPLHGLWAMASGGIFGVGLGNSKAKWSWLPAADNDYIFAIIGEELGLIGCLVVIVLFIFLTILFLRIIRDT
ncbi:cell division protein FtsW, partial [bacterium]|nr:cell division protein FtsW [bacterium]